MGRAGGAAASPASCFITATFWRAELPDRLLLPRLTTPWQLLLNEGGGKKNERNRSRGAVARARGALSPPCGPEGGGRVFPPPLRAITRAFPLSAWQETLFSDVMNAGNSSQGCEARRRSAVRPHIRAEHESRRALRPRDAARLLPCSHRAALKQALWKDFKNLYGVSNGVDY